MECIKYQGFMKMYQGFNRTLDTAHQKIVGKNLIKISVSLSILASLKIN